MFLYQIRVINFITQMGPKSARKILIGVPIEDLREIDGPTELIPGSHKQRISYWNFHLKKFFRKKSKISFK